MSFILNLLQLNFVSMGKTLKGVLDFWSKYEDSWFGKVIEQIDKIPLFDNWLLNLSISLIIGFVLVTVYTALTEEKKVRM